MKLPSIPCNTDATAPFQKACCHQRGGKRSQLQLWPAGREFFKKLDLDGDSKVTVEDVKKVMRQRKLPESYATKFISAARGNRWWSNSIRWGCSIMVIL